MRHKYRFLHPDQSMCQLSSSAHPQNAGSSRARNSTLLTVCNSQRLCSDRSGFLSALRVSLATHKVTLSFMAQKRENWANVCRGSRQAAARRTLNVTFASCGLGLCVDLAMRINLWKSFIIREREPGGACGIFIAPSSLKETLPHMIASWSLSPRRLSRWRDICRGRGAATWVWRLPMCVGRRQVEGGLHSRAGPY